MQQTSESSNYWLVSYITHQCKRQSRYEIDKYLLEAGYKAQDIEVAWQIISQPVKVAQPSLLAKTFYFVGALFSLGIAFLILQSAGSYKYLPALVFFLVFVIASIITFAKVPNSTQVKITIRLIFVVITILIVFMLLLIPRSIW
jgi:hypothetical protein